MARPVARIVLICLGVGSLGLVLACGGAATPTSDRQPAAVAQTDDLGPVPASDSSPSANEPPKGPKVYRTGEEFQVGYTAYRIDKAWWQDHLSKNQFLNQPPNAAYLFVQLAIANADQKPRMVAPYKLIDERGAEHQPSANAWAVEGSIGVLESLNPGVTKNGFAVFDVPRGQKYKLVVSGGYWSTEDAMVELEDNESIEREAEQQRAAAEAKLRAERAAAKQAKAAAADKAKWRTWTSAKGGHAIEAKFVTLLAGVVKLEKADGSTLDVKLDQLCDDDQSFIKEQRWLRTPSE